MAISHKNCYWSPPPPDFVYVMVTCKFYGRTIILFLLLVPYKGWSVFKNFKIKAHCDIKRMRAADSEGRNWHQVLNVMYLIIWIACKRTLLRNKGNNDVNNRTGRLHRHEWVGFSNKLRRKSQRLLRVDATELNKNRKI